MKIFLDGKEVEGFQIKFGNSILTITEKELRAEVISVDTIMKEQKPALLEGWIIAIDAGHGGADPGAVDGINPYEGDMIETLEKDLNRKIADNIISRLEELGAQVINIRQGDDYVELSERCRIANEANAHLFLSIHNNSATPAARGIETYHYPGSYYGSLLANTLHKYVAPASGLINRGVKTANFQVLRETIMPASLIEFGFITNPEEEATLHTNAFIDSVSQAVVDGFIEFCANYTELK